MPFAGDFTPPVNPGDSEPFSLDCAPQIPAGDSIASVTSALTVHYGSDPSPASRLSGSPTHSGTIAAQTLANLLPGVCYNLIFTVTTANGNTLVNYGRIACTPIV